ncbi:MAG: hypothetical protein M9928_09845 [Anaerolineae bacterium]|nr:hypothetical protein [Anaerolineae bacterium]MCO5205324.1 hypothetical protein [Anaerolineae bacterium]
MVLAALLVMGCGLTIPPPDDHPPTPTPLPDRVLNAQTECGVFDDICYMVITIVGLQLELQAYITVEVVGGIVFKPWDHDFWIISDDYRFLQSAEPVTVLQGETRQLRIPYDLAKDVHFPGEYSVIVRAKDIMTGDDVESVPAAIGKAYVGLNKEGMLVLLYTQDAFNKLYAEGFLAGANERLLYKIELESIVEPMRGNLYVKVIAPNYNYYPRVTVTVDGAVFFRVPHNAEQIGKETRTVTFAADMLGPMNTNGSRVMIIPFDLDHDSPPGIYAIRSILDGTDEQLQVVAQQEEIAPLRLEVKESIENMRNRWLVVTATGAVAIPTPTPFPTPEDSGSGGAETVELVWACCLSGYQGNLYQAYNDLIRDQIPLDYASFRAGMIERNEQLTEENDVLVRDEEYIAPQPPQP